MWNQVVFLCCVMLFTLLCTLFKILCERKLSLCLKNFFFFKKDWCMVFKKIIILVLVTFMQPYCESVCAFSNLLLWAVCRVRWSRLPWWSLRVRRSMMRGCWSTWRTSSVHAVSKNRSKHFLAASSCSMSKGEKRYIHLRGV